MVQKHVPLSIMLLQLGSMKPILVRRSTDQTSELLFRTASYAVQETNSSLIVCAQQTCALLTVCGSKMRVGIHAGDNCPPRLDLAATSSMHVYSRSKHFLITQYVMFSLDWWLHCGH